MLKVSIVLLLFFVICLFDLLCFVFVAVPVVTGTMNGVCDVVLCRYL